MHSSEWSSALKREQLIQKLEQEEFDLLVIGGGVTGAGIALDAATRGLKTALVEKEDFASGTSSRSTKLIHGGLRYLKQLEFKLVSEVGRERAIVHDNAPHLVIPEKMLLPLVKGGSYGKLATSIGLKVYDILANVKGDDRRKMLGKQATLEKEPLLDESTLLGGGYYAEYRTDDARLTISLIKTAIANEALCVNYCPVESFLYEGDNINGVQCLERLTGRKIKIQAKSVINAAGPWVDKIRKLNDSLTGKRLHLTKGIHIVVPYEKFPVKQSLYFDVPDGRMVFAIPRGKITYVGTTDTNYKGSLDRILITKEDVEYIVDSINNVFPNIQLDISDVQSGWAGLRPLIHEDGKSPSELSRKDEIFLAPDGLISIAGGKLTGYRKMAQRTLNLVAKNVKSKTKKLKLVGGEFNSFKEVITYIDEVAEKLGGTDSRDLATYLVYNYGRETASILAKYETFPNDNDVETAIARAELWFTINYEMVHNAVDFFVRRTGRLYFYINSVHMLKQVVLNDLQQYFGWDDRKKSEESEKLELEIQDVTQYIEGEPTMAVN